MCFDTSGSVGCDVTIDPTCSSYLRKSESVFLREAEQSKFKKHALNGVLETRARTGCCCQDRLRVSCPPWV
jgi:hypothetical protein